VAFLTNPQAIIHIMLEDKDEQAKECWEEFTLIRENSHCHWQCQSSLENDQPNNLISKFEEFKQLANLLKQDIQEIGQLISEFEEFKQLANLLKKDIHEVGQLISEFEEFKQLANLLKKDIQEVGQLISEFEEFKQLANLLKKDIQEVGQRRQRNDRLINIWCKK
jgi:prefoldin subunit 5